MAARGIVDELQDVVEKLGKIQNDQLGPLADEMSYTHGPQQAETFKSSVDQAIAGLLDQARSTKDAVNNAALVLSGEAASEMEPAQAELGGDMQDDMEADITADIAGGDESASGEAEEPLGQFEKRLIMKLASLLSEDKNYQAQLRNDINAYLVRLKANDIGTVGTDMLVDELTGMGYSVTPESLVDLLANSKYVSKVTVDTIDLGAPSGGKDREKDSEKVKDLAVKTAKKRI